MFSKAYRPPPPHTPPHPCPPKLLGIESPEFRNSIRKIDKQLKIESSYLFVDIFIFLSHGR